MSPTNVIPPQGESRDRIFQSGDIIRVTSFRGRARKWDISWIAVVVEHRTPEEPWFTADGLEGPCRIIWINGEEDEENFRRYFNTSLKENNRVHGALRRHDMGYVDHFDPNDPRLCVQLIDRPNDWDKPAK